MTHKKKAPRNRGTSRWKPLKREKWPDALKTMCAIVSDVLLTRQEHSKNPYHPSQDPTVDFRLEPNTHHGAIQLECRAFNVMSLRGTFRSIRLHTAVELVENELLSVDDFVRLEYLALRKTRSQLMHGIDTGALECLTVPELCKLDGISFAEFCELRRSPIPLPLTLDQGGREIIRRADYLAWHEQIAALKAAPEVK